MLEGCNSFGTVPTHIYFLLFIARLVDKARLPRSLLIDRLIFSVLRAIRGTFFVSRAAFCPWFDLRITAQTGCPALLQDLLLLVLEERQQEDLVELGLAFRSTLAFLAFVAAFLNLVLLGLISARLAQPFDLGGHILVEVLKFISLLIAQVNFH